MVVLASSYDESQYFKSDLAAEKKLRIKNVTEEQIGMDKDKEQKLVVWFTNDKRGLILNRVNNRTIRSAFGDTVDGWTGKIIVLFPTTAEFRGKMGPALRVRIPPPKRPPSAAAVAPQPSPSGNGATAAVQPSSGNGTAAAESKAATLKPPVVDDELDAEVSAKPSLADEMDDEIDF
jgi:hypothetical protein